MKNKKKKKMYTQNRELSWLKFNDRVLQEANDTEVPLLERLKFISIFISNFDEFFMIRVGSLFDLLAMNNETVDLRSGMTIKDQLKAIYKNSAVLYEKKDFIYEKLSDELKQESIFDLTYNELTNEEKKRIKQYFKKDILPILSPQIVDSLHPFPHIHNKSLYVATILKYQSEEVFGLIQIPVAIPTIFFFSSTQEETRFIRIENIIAQFVDKAFRNYTIEECAVIRVTRNADLNFNDENFNIDHDFRRKMKKLLTNRRKLAAVRLELSNTSSKRLQSYLQKKLSLTKRQVFYTNAPMDLSFAFSLQSKIFNSTSEKLVYKEFIPDISSEIDMNISMMEQVERKDLLLSFPYENMKPFLKLLKEAVNDDAVVSIKMTIYRLDSKAKLIEYLCQAAENGKNVTILIELRARFDEQNNIDWSERLEEAGCNIIYGFKKYKVHSKICLITKQVGSEVKYITQVGTGNYNEKTSKLYTDVSLLTYNQDIGKDVSEFFQNMGIANPKGSYEHLLVAPKSLKSTIIELIQEEAKKGSDGFILLKMNSITDVHIIKALKKASCAGVQIQMIIRGICCILPNIPNKTENIEVINIVGRFLEHSRIYVFGKNEEQKMYISSADFMTRNTEKRVEIACPIYDEAVKNKIHILLDACMKDNVKGCELKNNGEYVKKNSESSDVAIEKFDSQQHFIDINSRFIK